MQDPGQNPDIRAVSNVGSWMSYGARNSMRDAIWGPGPRTGSLLQCGPNVGSWTSCGARNPMRDAMRGRDTVRDPDFSVGPTAGSWTPCGAGNNMRDAMRGPGPQAVFKAGPVFIRDPEYRAASSMRDPGPRAESGWPVENEETCRRCPPRSSKYRW